MVEIYKNISDIDEIPESCRERFLPLSEDFAQPLRDAGVTFAGVSDLRMGYVIRRPRKPFHHILFTAAGEGWYGTPDSSGVLRPGDVWVVPRSVPQVFGTDNEWSVFWFHLTDMEQWSFLRSQPAHIRHFSLPHPLRPAMEQYVSECVSQKPGRETAARAYAEIICVHLERELQVDADPTARRIRSVLAQLWEDVNTKLHHPWRLKTLAARIHLSPMQFYRQVVRHQGMRPMDMVMRLRILRVKDLLRNTDHSLEAIAAQVGYETPFALSRAFKRHVGVSPRQYRSEHKPEQHT
jgi:AraC-like DNA-binding protein